MGTPHPLSDVPDLAGQRLAGALDVCLLALEPQRHLCRHVVLPWSYVMIVMPS